MCIFLILNTSFLTTNSLNVRNDKATRLNATSKMLTCFDQFKQLMQNLGFFQENVFIQSRRQKFCIMMNRGRNNLIYMIYIWRPSQDIYQRNSVVKMGLLSWCNECLLSRHKFISAMEMYIFAMVKKDSNCKYLFL